MLKLINDFLDNTSVSNSHLTVLDGWRGLSILFVLAGHLLPLGPKYLYLNEAFARMGMALFFILSGFLITRFLIFKPNIIHFIIRRFFRIIPLAWLYIVLSLLLTPMGSETYIAQLFFYANYPPFYLTDTTAHLWSLSVEMQFYVGIALLVGMLGKRGLYFLPVLCVIITLLRLQNDVHISIITYYRVDEILAGCCLALMYEGWVGRNWPTIFKYVNQPMFFLFLILLFFSCHKVGGDLAYFRPYFAALLIGSTLFNLTASITLKLNNKVLFYIAAISYSLYVIHPLLEHSWLGSGDTVEKYSKRILLFLVLLITSHISTFYYEKYWISFAKKLTR
ncbi:acyltransferase [Methylophaga sp. 41_12_T18]|nr:acyltransferase [Methylophaga sp. 41_12_T18]